MVVTPEAPAIAPLVDVAVMAGMTVMLGLAPTAAPAPLLMAGVRSIVVVMLIPITAVRYMIRIYNVTLANRLATLPTCVICWLGPYF
jgi:hypothetical protein